MHKMHVRGRLRRWSWLVVWLLLGVSHYPPAPSMAAEERVVLVDLAAVVKAHQAFLLGAGKSTLAPTGQEAAAIAQQQHKLRTLQERLSRDASRLSEAERKALQEQVKQAITALQDLYGQEMKALIARRRWASDDIIAAHLRERVQEFGKERGLPVILDRSDQQVLYRDPAGKAESPAKAVDPARPVLSGADGTVDLTQALIDWLREKDRDLAPPAGPPASGF